MTENIHKIGRQIPPSLSNALLLLLLVLLICSTQFGITLDELYHRIYGEHIVNFYESGFQNIAALSYENIFLYGGFFDTLCALFSRFSAPLLSTYTSRHLLNAVFGWIAVVYTVKIIHEHVSSRAAWIGFFLFCISPRFLGHCMNNPTDIPFAALFTTTIYYILKLERKYPFSSKKLLGALVISCALTLGVRVGAFLLVVYGWLMLSYLLFLERKALTAQQVRRVIIIATACSLMVLPLGCIFWPWASLDPFLRPIQAFSEMAKFSWFGTLLFKGEYYSAQNLPIDYIPIWFLVSTPYVVLLGLILFIGLLSIKRKDPLLVQIFILIIFPPLFIICRSSVIYDGLRHLLFVYPSVIIASAIGFDAIFVKCTNFIQRMLFLVIFLLGSYHPLSYMVRNFPYWTVYFNHPSQGVKYAFGTFELDYWANCFRDSLEWLHDKAQREGTHIKVSTIGGGWGLFGEYRRDFPLLDLLAEGPAGDYALQLMRFKDKVAFHEALEDSRTEHAITIDDIPICLIKKL